jgi:O-antigen/teichoic acid export membrane protein
LRGDAVTMRPILRQISIATLGHGLEKVIALVVVTVLVHYVDKTLMGEFFFAISVCTAAALLNEFGTSRYLVRTVAQDREGAVAYLGAVLRFRLPLLALTVVTINCIVVATAPQLLWMFVFTSIYVLSENLYYAFGSTLLGIGAVSARVVTGLIGPVLLLALVPAATLLDWSFDQIVIVYALAATVMAAIGFAVVVRRIGRVTILSSAVSARSVVAQCSLLFAVSAIVLLHSKIDEWMLAAMRDFREVAGYAAAYKLAEVSRTTIRPMTMVLFPIFAAAAARAAWQQVRNYAKRTLLSVALVSLAVAICMIVVAPWVVPLLFGADYPETVAITQVLFLATPAIFISYVALPLNSTLHLDKQTLSFAVASVALNFVLNLFIIPLWGAIGAAWTTLVTESLFSVCMVGLLTTTLKGRAVPELPSGRLRQ